jgi:hypothetical protein
MPNRQIARHSKPIRFLPIFERLESRQILSADFHSEEFHVTPISTNPIQAAPPIPAGTPASVSLTGINLHSNPGATKSIYLDFTGHTTTGTLWNEEFGTVTTKAFSIDNDFDTFSDTEIAVITEVWKWVSEDYSPFDVNVTTQDPGLSGLTKTNDSDNSYGVRVVIGGSSLDWLQPGQPFGTAAGVAFLDTFTSDIDVPVFVFQTETNNDATQIAAATSHEVGHSLNLVHDGTSELEYYPGHGDWSPIMGADYTSLNQWSKGEYFDANNQEDDLAIITSHGLSYRADEAGNTTSTAASLTPISSINANFSGIISKSTDVDFFKFFIDGTGKADITINPNDVGPDLDILATIYNSSGVVITANNPLGALNASFNLTLPSGSYYLSIDGTGEGNPLTTGYSDYGSLGQYTINVALSGGATFDTTGPTINAVTSNPAVINASMDSFDVTFSTPIDLSTFTAADISLTRDAGPNLITPDISIVLVSGSTYRIQGTSDITSVNGKYALTIHPQGIADAAGNAGTGKDFVYTIDIDADNQQPSFKASNPPAVSEDSGSASVVEWSFFTPGPSHEAKQTATYIVSDISNPSLFLDAPTIDTFDTLSYTPAPDAVGASTFTVRVKDSGGGDNDTSDPQTFTITVNPVNDAPSFIAVDPAASAEDAGKVTLDKWATFVAGPANESAQTNLGYTVSSVTNTSLFSVLPSVDINGTLTYTSAPNANGTATFRLQVKDSGNGSNTSSFQTFTITVNSVEDAPVIGSINLGAIGYAGLDAARFTASNITDIDSTIAKVSFYLDANKNGTPEESELLGKAKLNAGVWVLDLYAPSAPLGDNHVLAVATDFTGVSSTPVAAPLAIYRSVVSDKSIQYVDSNGNTVKASLTGGGTIKAYFESDTAVDVTKLTVENSSPTKSALTITVTKGKNSTTDQTTIGNINIAAGLLTFSGTKVNLAGNFTAGNTIKTLTLNNLVEPLQQSINIGGAATDKSSFTFGQLSNVFVSTTSTVTAFKALDWQDTDDNADFLTAASLGSLTISGRAASKTAPALAGDFEAAINLSLLAPAGSKTVPTVSSIAIAGSAHGSWNLRSHKLSSAAIKGSVLDSQWASLAGFGSITISGTVSNLTLDTEKDVTSFKAGQVKSSHLTVDGSLGSLTVIEFIQGQITAGKTGTIATTGRAASKGVTAIAGDFSGRLLIVGASTAANSKSVAGITIKGSASGDFIPEFSDWQFTGGVGAISIAGNTNNLIIKTSNKGDSKSNLGNIASFTVAGSATNTALNIAGSQGAVTVGGSNMLTVHAIGGITSYTSKGQTKDTVLTTPAGIGAVTSVNWLSGSITAAKLAAVTTKGQAASKTAPAIAGDFSGDIQLSGNGVTGKANALASASIAGTMSNAVWRIAGNSGSITVGAIIDSTIFIGVNPLIAPLALPTAKGQFANPAATLAGFTVTGKAVANPNTTPTFTNTRISAGILTSISLKVVDPASTAASGISAATKITAYARQTGPKATDLLKLSNKTAAGTYDPATPGETGFRLVLVS